MQEAGKEPLRKCVCVSEGIYYKNINKPEEKESAKLLCGLIMRRDKGPEENSS